MFQIGSNDIEQKTPDEVIEEIEEELVRVTQRYNPDATITFGEILPRFLSDRYYAKFFNEHRLIFNVQLYELCKDLDLHFVRYDFIQPDYFVDGIHIKGHGIPIMVMSIKRVLNTLLNVKLWENNEYNTKTNHVRNNGIPNYQMPNSITNRKQRDHQAFEQKSHFNNPIHVGSESAINGRNKIVNMMELMLQEMRTVRIQRVLEKTHSIKTSRQAIRKFLDRLERSGSVTDLPKRRRNGNITNFHRQMMNLLLSKNCELTSGALRDKIMALSGLKLSSSCVSKIRRKLGWTTQRVKFCQLISHHNKLNKFQWCLASLER
ncbi:unnamed protein product [Mytilus edulis]|uniref:Uncharacterized protein n=1 Tax=Mytilus edulis TaxID=6550 RepID=A0A8S3RYG9_MYTED|nr:unnamed protein product [Mytilus edulis]